MRTHVCTLSTYYVMLVLANLVYTQAPIAAVGGSQGTEVCRLVVQCNRQMELTVATVKTVSL